ncbi:E3 ubiquitin-protein ligase ATL6-like [Dendrobium catenatum]|uniref:E3 ubiquitin-protein ligase ATL6-like n=1 Tax=Dendrobium catenatum TaxID=906689 RepID=UPI00109FDDFD|nr:E3 ubiquitin-protein ligase ATL6-like [Dendrobium catenatum]
MKCCLGHRSRTAAKKFAACNCFPATYTLSAVRCSPLLFREKNDENPLPILSNGGTDLPFVVAGCIRFNSEGLIPRFSRNFPDAWCYSEVKGGNKIGKGALECAICLNEIRRMTRPSALPRVRPLFSNQECVDACARKTHVTCLFARANYTFYFSRSCIQNSPPRETMGPMLPPAPPHQAFTSRRSAGQIMWISRSHSTGHSMMPQGEAGLDRFTLRLPEKQ